jgi:hypothetical protein
MLKDTIEWIRSMMQPRPVYPVEYVPPVVGFMPDTEEPEQGERAPR